jgi:signal transduction histidine kinase
VDSGQPPNDVAITSGLLLRNTFGSALFAAIPAMLGAWVGGRRSVPAWTALTVIANFMSDAIMLAPNWSALRFVIGPTLSLVVVVGILSYFVGSLADKMRAEQEQLAHANRQLEEQAHVREQLAGSRERVRLSREMHDTLAHTLAAATVQLEAVQVIWETQPERARQLVEESAVTMRGGLQDTRRALQALRAAPLESLGFVASIYLLAESIQARYGVNTTIETAGDVLWLTQEQEHVVYRVVQEAMLNSAQHAHAQQIRITIEETGGALRLTIKDNGSGFDPSAVDISAHFGVQGMRERAAMIGAELHVSSGVGQGTQVEMLLNREPDENSSL